MEPKNLILFKNPNSPNNPPMDADFFKEFRILRCEFVISGEYADLIIEGDKTIKCKVVLTEYRFIIKLQESTRMFEEVQEKPDYEINFFNCPVYMIAKVEKSIDKKQLTLIKIDIATKDNRSYSLFFDCTSSIYTLLTEVLRPRDGNLFTTFAKKYREYHPVNINGWTIYNCIKEYTRQNAESSEYVRRSNYNEHFNICDTYPEVTYHPSSINEDDVREGALFRTKQRYPALAYYHKPNNGSLWRSSQTKSGLTNNRSTVDEKVLSAIADISLIPKKLIVYDARPYLAAYANKIKGAGFEIVENYPRTEIVFCEIDHIHAVRSAFQKMMLLVDTKTIGNNKNYSSQWEVAGWGLFIYQIIKSSLMIMKSIKDGYSVLVHCSDGWDRASQLTAFSQLLLDPFYRTLEGFIVLIEKEFLSFGHQFRTRSGFCEIDILEETQISPVFLQWLDCVHQLLVQYPFYFEFNMELLLFVAYHLNSCKYGTFLYNCEKERREKGAYNKTVSIWTDVLEFKAKFLNPYYDERTQKEFFLIDSFPLYKVRLWEEYFLRFKEKGSYSKELIRRETVKNNEDVSTMEELNIVDAPFYIRPISNIAIMTKSKMKDKYELEALRQENELMKSWIKEQMQTGQIKELPDSLNELIKDKSNKKN